MYNTNSKRKSMIFSKKKFFFNIFDFFSKGGTLWCRNRQKKFFPFFKNFKNKTQKWLSWDHSNINRNKVRNFGGRSSYPAESARPFTVVRAIMAPRVQNRVNSIQNVKNVLTNFTPKLLFSFLDWYNVITLFFLIFSSFVKLWLIENKPLFFVSEPHFITKGS